MPPGSLLGGSSRGSRHEPGRDKNTQPRLGVRESGRRCQPPAVLLGTSMIGLLRLASVTHWSGLLSPHGTSYGRTFSLCPIRRGPVDPPAGSLQKQSNGDVIHGRSGVLLLVENLREDVLLCSGLSPNARLLVSKSVRGYNWPTSLLPTTIVGILR